MLIGLIFAVLAIGCAWLWIAIRRMPKRMKGGRMMVAEYRARASAIEKSAETEPSQPRRKRIIGVVKALRELSDRRERELGRRPSAVEVKALADPFRSADLFASGRLAPPDRLPSSEAGPTWPSDARPLAPATVGRVL